MLVAVDGHITTSRARTTSVRRISWARHGKRRSKGEKDKLGLMMITQNPDDIDGEVLKQTNTNIFLHLREEVIEDVASIPRGYKRDIPKFSKGQAVIKAPDVEAVEVVGLPDCLTRHDS